ncbi:hypothetical protein HZH68_016218 [Vespula germanica]|uniref:Uncharacterized protein n=1 Tax=Vespula germanica TaxID=30212 RepID=A0A834J1A6_VESGE|nr:hypothetical protein HZH68_016218 [Vespula germanica]
MEHNTMDHVKTRTMFEKETLSCQTQHVDSIVPLRSIKTVLEAEDTISNDHNEEANSSHAADCNRWKIETNLRNFNYFRDIPDETQAKAVLIAGKYCKGLQLIDI